MSGELSRRGAELAEHGELVEDTPVLGDPAVGDPEDPDRGHHKAPPRGRPAHELTVMGAANGHPGGHSIPGAEQVLDGEPEVGEPGPQHPVLLVHAVAGRRDPAELLMVQELLGDQVVQPVEPAKVERLLVVATHQAFTAVVSHALSSRSRSSPA
jgi:hypothetical protein